jgi:hypothetical protein
MIALFKGAPVIMTVACILAGALGAYISYRQNQPELDRLNAKLEQLHKQLQTTMP